MTSKPTASARSAGTSGATVTKPPYRVPLMTEIAAAPATGLVAVSTFSGAGGSCLGLRMAGFEVRWASEFIPAAQDVYRANHAAHLDTRDIREVDPAEVLEVCGLEPGELDLLEGSPPCASFSSAGKREKTWGEVRKYSDTKQRVDDLFFEYVRLLRGLQPRVFVAENVAGLVKGVSKGYFKEILAALKDSGYRVRAQVLDAQWLGVPQTRARVFFVGVREDLGLDPAFPTPLPYRYSIRDACPWIGTATYDERRGRGERQIVDRPAHTVLAGGDASRNQTDMPEPVLTRSAHGKFDGRPASVDEPAPTVPSREWGGGYVHHGLENAGPPPEWFGDCAIGREYDNLRPGQGSDKYLNLVRTHPDKPSGCVTASGGHRRGAACVVHPYEKRKFTIPELRRICGFPDDFVLFGTYGQQWERLGRSVPPPMMRAVAERLRDAVLLRAESGPGAREAAPGATAAADPAQEATEPTGP